MIKTIITAIASALRAFVRVAGAIAMSPLRLVDRVLYGDRPPAFEAPVPYSRGVDEASDGFDRQEMYLELANRIIAWAAESIEADRPVQLAGRDIPRAVRSWLPGLTRAECAAIIGSDERAVSAHLQKLFLLPGVRPVQRLPRLREWPAEPAPANDAGSPSFIFFADAGLPERPPARAQAVRSSDVAPG
ncbi:MAG TPA: hypothetical protein VF499_12475 [Afipia sp.]